MLWGLPNAANAVSLFKADLNSALRIAVLPWSEQGFLVVPPAGSNQRTRFRKRRASLRKTAARPGLLELCNEVRASDCASAAQPVV